REMLDGLGEHGVVSAAKVFDEQVLVVTHVTCRGPGARNALDERARIGGVGPYGQAERVRKSELEGRAVIGVRPAKRAQVRHHGVRSPELTQTGGLDAAGGHGTVEIEVEWIETLAAILIAEGDEPGARVVGIGLKDRGAGQVDAGSHASSLVASCLVSNHRVEYRVRQSRRPAGFDKCRRWSGRIPHVAELAQYA